MDKLDRDPMKQESLDFAAPVDDLYDHTFIPPVVGVSPRMVTFFRDFLENVTMRTLTPNTDPEH